jgi:hypothetical protein
MDSAELSSQFRYSACAQAPAETSAPAHRHHQRPLPVLRRSDLSAYSFGGTLLQLFFFFLFIIFLALPFFFLPVQILVILSVWLPFFVFLFLFPFFICVVSFFLFFFRLSSYSSEVR